MFNIFDAGALGLIVSTVTIVAALALQLMQKKEKRTSSFKEYARHSENACEDFSAFSNKLIHEVFSNMELSHYRDRMISSQPIDNDRILSGYGKTHTLCAIIAITATSDRRHPVPAVIDQVGDIFS